jgi:hypothetical protein
MFYINQFYWLGYRTRSISVAYEYFADGKYYFCAIRAIPVRNLLQRIHIHDFDVKDPIDNPYLLRIVQLGPECLRRRVRATRSNI